jgi:hypothetical protein
MPRQRRTRIVALALEVLGVLILVAAVATLSPIVAAILGGFVLIVAAQFVGDLL